MDSRQRGRRDSDDLSVGLGMSRDIGNLFIFGGRGKVIAVDSSLRLISQESPQLATFLSSHSSYL